jgi:SAM-dependent methyltransferase
MRRSLPGLCRAVERRHPSATDGHDHGHDHLCRLRRASRTAASRPARRSDRGQRHHAPGWPTWLTDTAQFEELQRDRAEQLLDILGHDGATAGRLLDVRCDVGALVTAAAARGWDATGAERVPAVADMARQRAEPLGARIVGDLDDLPDAAGSFDVVVACDWIEREPSPIDALRELRRFVAPGGRVVIATPNWRSAARRWDGERWQHLRALESITFFDPTTLRRAFAGAGMSDVRVRCTTWRSDDLTVAAHTLVPIRRIALSRTHDPTPLTAAALRRLLDVYDRCGVGDTLVAVARIGGATPQIAQPVAPPTAAPTGGPT